MPNIDSITMIATAYSLFVTKLTGESVFECENKGRGNVENKETKFMKYDILSE